MDPAHGALQSFGVVPVAGGSGAGFFILDPVAGVIQMAAGLVSLALAYGLWQRQSWARKAVMVIAAANIAITVVSWIGSGESWWNAVPSIVLSTALLLSARTPEAREKFDQ